MFMNAIRDQLTENLRSIRDRIAAACTRANRSVDDVTLVAVTKYADLDRVRELVQLGERNLGEARPQQLLARAKQLPADVRWHLIGHLQRNKAEGMLPLTSLIHSVDSLRLFEHIAKLGKSLAKPPHVLLEVNVSGEASKDGFDREGLLAAWPQMRTCESIEVSGLMTMAPLGNAADVARPVFRRLRELRDHLRKESAGHWQLNELSMGMSGDFEIGIEEGATIVRVGSSLFAGLVSGQPHDEA
jgi:pyridoxal phosphate enzyme (YggS family)